MRIPSSKLRQTTGNWLFLLVSPKKRRASDKKRFLLSPSVPTGANKAAVRHIDVGPPKRATYCLDQFEKCVTSFAAAAQSAHPPRSPASSASPAPAPPPVPYSPRSSLPAQPTLPPDSRPPVY